MCEEVTVCMLRCVAVAVYRNCGLWELWCGGVVVCGSCTMVEQVSVEVMMINCVFSVFVFSAFFACFARKKNI